MRTFEDKFEGIEYELKNVEGESFIIKTSSLSIGEIKEVKRLQKEAVKGFKEEHFSKMLGMTFKKEVSFFDQFSLPMLIDLLDAVNEDKIKKNETQAG